MCLKESDEYSHKSLNKLLSRTLF